MPAPAAQPADPHAGHHMPAEPAAPAADPHAGHRMPTEATPPAADPHAGHTAQRGADLPVGSAAPPPTVADAAADRIFPPDQMDRARAILRAEHGGARLSKTMVDLFELRPSDAAAYAWEAEHRFGGDINRLVLKTEGEGEVDHRLERGEVQALWSRAAGPYFDIQAGVRQDFAPRGRTYAALGFDGLAPYWFDVEGTLFLSSKGDLSARLEGAYDLRLTQRLILQPRAELALSASDVPELRTGSGLSTAELAVRLRYELGLRELAPYVGLIHERSFGRTADFARAAGEDEADTRLVVGLRVWF